MRGGGPGLFGVVTKLHLKAYPLPKLISNNTLVFPISELESVSEALVRFAPQVDRNVELLGYIVLAPEELARRSSGPDGHLAMYLNANAYCDDPAEAKRMVEPMMNHAVAQRAFDSTSGRHVTIDELYFEEELSFGQRRWIADNVFTNRLPEVARVLRRQMPTCPAPGAAAVFVYKGSPALPEASCSVIGDFYAAFYMVWDNPTEDTLMMDYIVNLYREIAPLGTGSSIIEMNQESLYVDVDPLPHRSWLLRRLPALRQSVPKR